MGAYLRGLKSFQVDVATTDEDVLGDGQKYQYEGAFVFDPPAGAGKVLLAEAKAAAGAAK